jgi:hypothetical protein
MVQITEVHEIDYAVNDDVMRSPEDRALCHVDNINNYENALNREIFQKKLSNIEHVEVKAKSDTSCTKVTCSLLSPKWGKN